MKKDKPMDLVSEVTKNMVNKILTDEYYCWGCKEKLTYFNFSEISSFYGLCMKCLLAGKLKGKTIKFKF